LCVGEEWNDDAEEAYCQYDSHGAPFVRKGREVKKPVMIMTRIK
jgi:hypothetical protein